MLDVTEGNQTVSLQLDPSQNYSGHSFDVASDGNGGTTVVDPQTVFTVTSASALNAAIKSVDASGSAASNYTIYVQGFENLSTSGQLEAINLPSSVSLLIQGTNGSTVFGNGQYRGFFVYSGNVVFQNMRLNDMKAVGGAGGSAAAAAAPVWAAACSSARWAM